MKYRRFGKTELQMPLFSCGGMRYQQGDDKLSWDEVKKENQDNINATIARAFELGINHIETARGYGSSEMQLGPALAQLPRDQVRVQTKIGVTPNADDFFKVFEVSLDRLKLDYLDLLSIHGINSQEMIDLAFKKNGCYEALVKLKEQGRVRHIGFSTHGNPDIIIQAIDAGDFEYVNLHWYYIFQNNWPAVRRAAEKDMGVFIISPSDKGGMLYEPTDKFLELCKPLHPMVFNDLFCLSRPEVHTLSIGAARPSDFDEHLKALDLLDRADEIISPVKKRLDQAMIDCLGEEWVKTWDQGLTYNETVEGLNIWVLLFLWNLIKTYGMTGYGKMRYDIFGTGGHWFPGDPIKGIDELRKLNLAEKLPNSPHADKITACLEEVYDFLHETAAK
jgi:hypothetical protein